MIAYNSKAKLLQEWNPFSAQSHGREGREAVSSLLWNASLFLSLIVFFAFVLPALSPQVDGRLDKAGMFCLQAAVEIVTQQGRASDLR